jgi:hypothetical protein
MKKLSAILLFLVCVNSAPALDIVKAIIAITNNPAISNKLGGNSVTRTWTNDTTSSPSTLIATNNGIGPAATNLFLHLATYPFSQSQNLTRSNNNVVALQGSPGEAMVFTATGWGTVTYQTNQITNQTYLVRMPLEVEVSSNRIAIASHIVRGTSLYSSNSFGTGTVAMANFADLTSAQTLQKKLVTNSTLAGVKMTNSSWSSTNSYCSNCTADAMSLTNSANYGNAFSSPGSGTLSEQFGLSASATGGSSLAVGAATSATADNATAINANATADNASALGILAVASGTNSTAIGTVAIASGFNSAAFGYNSLASYEGATALGVNTLAQNTNSTAVGYGAATTRNNQVMLGAAAVDVEVNNVLHAGATTNSLFVGTNILTGSIAFTPRSIATLVNGNNAGVELGTNTLVQLSGATTYCELAGFVAKESGRIYEVEISGAATNYIINYTGSSRSTDGTAARRIETGTGGDLTLTNNPAFIRIYYNTTVSRWRVMSFSR